MAAPQPVAGTREQPPSGHPLAARWRVPAPLVFLVALFLAWELGAAVLAASGDRLGQLKLPFPHLVLAALLKHVPLLAGAAWQTGVGGLIRLTVGTGKG